MVTEYDTNSRGISNHNVLESLCFPYKKSRLSAK